MEKAGYLFRYTLFWFTYCLYFSYNWGSINMYSYEYILYFSCVFQLETPWLRVLPGRVVQYGATAHAAVSWVPGNIAHVAAMQQGPSDPGYSGFVPTSDEASRDVMLPQLGSASETGILCAPGRLCGMLIFLLIWTCVIHIFTFLLLLMTHRT